MPRYHWNGSREQLTLKLHDDRRSRRIQSEETCGADHGKAICKARKCESKVNNRSRRGEQSENGFGSCGWRLFFENSIACLFVFVM
ncbi:hypothetical protein, partial [Brevibacterium luteolum]|uniref:hypothetical protein n=1 Tax=Brevibacterium luteolum TaxID=199591 RepID=UPI00223C19ED